LFLDKLRFNQILFNLLSNAVKFTPKGGHVSLVFDTYEITPTSLKLDVTVKDDGIGIDKAFQKKLFHPFEQESTSNNSMRTGSGLGLSIVKSLVELMGGTITVHSSKGRGSEFKIHHLPCAIVPAVAETVSKKSSPVSLQGKQILLAEDNAINAEIMTRLLEKKGAKVTVATDGLIVVKQYADSEQYTYDAILMDVQMPNQDGLAATQAIRQLNRPDAQSIPIIALTANAYDDDVRTCLKAGMNAHLAKPVASRIYSMRLCKTLA
jgi:CheY-like chemotaxis protein